MIWNEYLTGLWLFTYIYYITNLFMVQKKKNYFLTSSRIILFAFLYTINNIYTEPLMGFILHIFISILFVFLEFTEKKAIVFHFFTILYLIRFFFEFLFFIILTILNINFPSKNTLVIMTSLLSLLFIFYYKNFLKDFILNPSTRQEKYKRKKIALKNLGLLIILIIRIPNFPTYLNTTFFMNLFLFFIIFNLVLLLFEEIEKIEALNKNYKKIVEYSEFTEGLLTEYKSFVHEYKNKLFTIKGLANQKNKRELHEYIDSILDEKVMNNYRWLSELKNIPIAGAKGLINFKLLKMKELNMDVEVYISEEISKLKEDFLSNKEKNDLYTLLGIILDNAIEASLESQDKMISLQLYKENEEIIILLANTFKHIQLDHMEEKGFSSKGKNRGIGLYLFQNIIKHSNVFSKETSVYDNFFIQKIIIRKANSKLALKKNTITSE